MAMDRKFDLECDRTTQDFEKTNYKNKLQVALRVSALRNIYPDFAMSGGRTPSRLLTHLMRKSKREVTQAIKNSTLPLIPATTQIPPPS
jgi:hypothetical protein